MDNILELQNITKVYGTSVKTQVLTDINISFKKGSFSSIIGQSGSGKSTLLNIMGTLDEPSSGEVFIDGTETSRLSKNALADIR
ncbi:MAG: ATP-binding cassette domain-containing protein, partial [Eubacteriales bacterium]|nr:ATP-binding cassette domain-containing protein [Eubacteriales bacterium]